MSRLETNRRSFLAATALAGASLPLARMANAKAPRAADAPFEYEVVRTEAEWREMLSEEEYEILREGGTEFPTSNPLWNDYSPGEFYCRGCDLHLFAEEWRANIQLGWVFFHHAIPNSVLTAIDTAEGYPGGDPKQTLIEAHCRRCGSHLGHIIKLEEELVFCINGTSLVLQDGTA